MAETRVWGVLDWRQHAVCSVVCALAAVADVAMGYPWIALIPAFASGACSTPAVDFWYRRHRSEPAGRQNITSTNGS